MTHSDVCVWARGDSVCIGIANNLCKPFEASCQHLHALTRSSVSIIQTGRCASCHIHTVNGNLCQPARLSDSVLMLPFCFATKRSQFLLVLQAAKRARDSDYEDGASEEEERPKKHSRAAALASSKAQPAALMTSKRVNCRERCFFADFSTERLYLDYLTLGSQLPHHKLPKPCLIE